MKNSIKKFLLLSVFATQFLGTGMQANAAAAAAAATNEDVAQLHVKQGGTKYYVPEATTQAMVTSLGMDGSVTVHEKLDLIKGAIPTPDAAKSAADAQRLTLSVNALIDSVFDDYAVANNSDTLRFVGEGALTSGDGAQITGKASWLSLFSVDPTKPKAVDIYLLTPTDKLSLLLRAVFGIKKTDFAGYFTSAIDKEDAGVVLTKVFDKVLGIVRDGTNGTNKFGVSSGNPKFGALDATNAVKDYFANKGIKGDASNDITRLRALISDITGRASAN